jgi:hypothetical protein
LTTVLLPDEHIALSLFNCFENYKAYLRGADQ